MRAVLLTILIAGSVYATNPVPVVTHEPHFDAGWKIDRSEVFIPDPPLKPEYPAKAIEAGVAAAVWVRATVKRSGDVESAELAYSTDSSMGFNEACIQAVTQAKLAPSRRPHTVLIPFLFVLDSIPEGHPPSVDELVLVDTQPEMISQKAPEYPRPAKQAGLGGTVWVKALVDVQGRVRDARVAKSCGTPILDKAAIEAAYGNRFNPARYHGHPVAIWVTYKVVFSVANH